VLDHGRIQLTGTAFVYLQRTLGGSESYGLVPAAELPSGVVVGSVAPGESVWVGFEALDRDRPASIRVRVEGSPPSDPVTLTCPPDYCLRVGDDCVQFRAGDELRISASRPEAAEAWVRLVSPEEFTRLTGRVPEPLDPDAAYKGWLLP
jgi:hypothetical protein